MSNNKQRRVAMYGVLIALALVLSYLESLVPAFFAVPGMKIGLSNLVVLSALYLLDAGSAVFMNLVRIFLVGFLFGSGVSLIYSLAGGLLSGLVMILLKKSGKFHLVTVSVAGGISHNVGQILAAMVLLSSRAIAWYLLVLWFSGIASGALIGMIGAALVKRLEGVV